MTTNLFGCEFVPLNMSYFIVMVLTSQLSQMLESGIIAASSICHGFRKMFCSRSLVSRISSLVSIYLPWERSKDVDNEFIPIKRRCYCIYLCTQPACKS